MSSWLSCRFMTLRLAAEWKAEKNCILYSNQTSAPLPADAGDQLQLLPATLRQSALLVLQFRDHLEMFKESSPAVPCQNPLQSQGSSLLHIPLPGPLVPLCKQWMAAGTTACTLSTLGGMK